MCTVNIHDTQLRSRKQALSHLHTYDTYSLACGQCTSTAFKIVARRTNVVSRQQSNATHFKINAHRTLSPRIQQYRAHQLWRIVEWPYV